MSLNKFTSLLLNVCYTKWTLKTDKNVQKHNFHFDYNPKRNPYVASVEEKCLGENNFLLVTIM